MKDKERSNHSGNYNPLVSIVIPVYNTEKEYLKICLESIDNQTYNNIEVIIIDDGSSSYTSKLIDSIVDKFSSSKKSWRVIHQENRGLSAARNRGYDASKGEYVQFLDADDYFDSKLIEKSVKKMEKTGADIVIESFTIEDYKTGHKYVVPSPDLFPNKEIFKLKELKRNRFQAVPYNVWSKMFRKSFLEKYNFRHDEDLMRAEDVLFSCKSLVVSEKISFISSPYITYRENLPSGNTGTNDKYPVESVKSWRRLYDFLLEEDYYSLFKEDFENAMLESIYWHLKRLKTREGQESLMGESQEFVLKYIQEPEINDYSTEMILSIINPKMQNLFLNKIVKLRELEHRLQELEIRLTESTNHLNEVLGVRGALNNLRKSMKNFILKRLVRK